MTSEPISALDLEAYVDGQLDTQRRFEVEDHLARAPDAAAKVMADLRTREALRLLAAPRLGPASSAQIAAAHKLGRGLRQAQGLRRGGRIAALFLLFAGGVGVGLGAADLRGESVAEPPPTFVTDAAMAHRTALVRAAMRSQPQATKYDPDEIRSATRISLPRLPEDWHVDDVQVFPAHDGPSVEVALSAGELGPASLFAAHSPRFGVIAPTLVDQPDGVVAYWQVGRHVYALTAKAPRAELAAAARALSSTLH